MKAVTQKTAYNHSTDGWEVYRDGNVKVEGRAAILAIPPGTTITLKRGNETKQLTIIDDDGPTAGDAFSLILDAAPGLGTENRKVLEALLKSQKEQSDQKDKLVAMAMGMASTATALNAGLSVSLAQAWGENNTLRTLVRRDGESPESWFDRLINNLPHLIQAGRLVLAPLPPEDDKPAEQPAKES